MSKMQLLMQKHKTSYENLNTPRDNSIISTSSEVENNPSYSNKNEPVGVVPKPTQHQPTQMSEGKDSTEPQAVEPTKPVTGNDQVMAAHDSDSRHMQGIASSKCTDKDEKLECDPGEIGTADATDVTHHTEVEREDISTIRMVRAGTHSSDMSGECQICKLNCMIIWRRKRNPVYIIENIKRLDVVYIMEFVDNASMSQDISLLASKVFVHHVPVAILGWRALLLVFALEHPVNNNIFWCGAFILLHAWGRAVTNFPWAITLKRQSN